MAVTPWDARKLFVEKTAPAAGSVICTLRHADSAPAPDGTCAPYIRACLSRWACGRQTILSQSRHARDSGRNRPDDCASRAVRRQAMARQGRKPAGCPALSAPSACGDNGLSAEVIPLGCAGTRCAALPAANGFPNRLGGLKTIPRRVGPPPGWRRLAQAIISNRAPAALCGGVNAGASHAWRRKAYLRQFRYPQTTLSLVKEITP